MRPARTTRVLAHHAKIGHRPATVGDRDRQIKQRAPRIMAALPRPQRPRRHAQRIFQAGPPGALQQQRYADMVDRLIVSVRRHRHADLAAIALHLQGDPPEPSSQAFTTRKLPAQPDRTSASAPAEALTLMKDLG